MKKFRIILALLFVTIFAGTQVQSAYAIDNIDTTTVEKIETDDTTSSSSSSTTSDSSGYLVVDENDNVISNPADGIMSDVTVEEVTEKISSKLNELIVLLQTIGLPICIICGIAALISMVFGLFTGRRSWMTGMIAFGICVIAYTMISYGPSIVAFLSNWIVS